MPVVAEMKPRSAPERTLRPMFTYYGGKWRAAPKYPQPRCRRIIEPFAGSAGYSMRYPHYDVTLYDVDEAVYGVWHYLIHVSEKEILCLPLEVRHVSDLAVCQEAKWLIGYWLNKACVSPRLSPSCWMRSGIRPDSQWGEAIRARIASQLRYIRHWKIYRGSYVNTPDVEATWFIDPPYKRSGSRYRNLIEDYGELASWCKERKGQVIVCEQAGADWLPFRPFATIKSAEGKYGKKRSEEVIWTNES